MAARPPGVGRVGLPVHLADCDRAPCACLSPGHVYRLCAAATTAREQLRSHAVARWKRHLEPKQSPFVDRIRGTDVLSADRNYAQQVARG